MNESILIVEDEVKIASILQDYLKAEGYLTHIIENGGDVVPWFKQHKPDLVLLDLMLPEKDGITICKELRQFSAVPIIMVTARVDEVDRLIGLDVGADDYVCKPFSPKEVVARVKATLRRTKGDVIHASNWHLDTGRLEFSYEGTSVTLTAAEFQLVAKLCSDPGRIYSRSQLMNDMYDDHRVVSERTIDSHVRKIRAKFADAFPEIELIESVYGAGYRLTP